MLKLVISIVIGLAALAWCLRHQPRFYEGALLGLQRGNYGSVIIVFLLLSLPFSAASYFVLSLIAR